MFFVPGPLKPYPTLSSLQLLYRQQVESCVQAIPSPRLQPNLPCRVDILVASVFLARAAMLCPASSAQPERVAWHRLEPGNCWLATRYMHMANFGLSAECSARASCSYPAWNPATLLPLFYASLATIVA